MTLVQGAQDWQAGWIEHVGTPLGITTMFAGIPAELEPRVAFLELVPDPAAVPGPPGNPAEQMAKRGRLVSGS